MYAPTITSARQVRSGWIDGRYWVELLADIEAWGAIAYRFLLAVRRDGGREPVLWVSAEESFDFAGSLFGDTTPKPPSYTLGVFVGGTHENHGRSPDWGDEARFETRAFEIVRERIAAGSI